QALHELVARSCEGPRAASEAAAVELGLRGDDAKGQLRQLRDEAERTRRTRRLFAASWLSRCRGTLRGRRRRLCALRRCRRPSGLRGLRRRRLDGALDLVGVRVRRRQRVGLVAAEHALLRTARRIALDLDAGALVLAGVLRLAGYLDRSATLLHGRLNIDVLVVVTRSLPNVRGELAVRKIRQRDDDPVAVAHHLRARRLRD